MSRAPCSSASQLGQRARHRPRWGRGTTSCLPRPHTRHRQMPPRQRPAPGKPDASAGHSGRRWAARQPGQRARCIAPTLPHPPGHLPHRSTCYRPETQVLKCEPSLNEILAIVSNHRPHCGRASKGTGHRAQSHGSLRANSPSEGHGWSPSGWGGGRAGVPNVGHTGVSLTVQAGTHPYTHTHTHTPPSIPRRSVITYQVRVAQLSPTADLTAAHRSGARARPGL